MNTQNLSTLQVFQSFSHKCKCLFLQSCPKEFIRFLCESILNLLEGNLQSMKRYHVVEYQSEVRILTLKRRTWKQRSDILSSDEILQFIKVISTLLINHLSWYGAICLRSCFCVQKNLITQSVTKRELPKCQPSQNPMYQIDTLKKELNKIFFSEADF